MRISSLMKHLQDYMDMYGDQPVTVHNLDDGDDVRIVHFDAFKNELSIHVSAEEEA